MGRDEHGERRHTLIRKEKEKEYGAGRNRKEQCFTKVKMGAFQDGKMNK